MKVGKMYTFQREHRETDQFYKDFLHMYPPITLLVFNYLNGESDASQDIKVPPGIIKRVHVWISDTETDHEDVGWQIWLDNVVIYPTQVVGNAGWEIPVAGAGAVQTMDLNYRVLKDATISGAINGISNLTSGLTICIEYMEFPTYRGMLKTSRAKEKGEKE
jgi:hypothetical protein